MTDVTAKRVDEISDKLDRVIAAMATKDDLRNLETGLLEKLGRRMDEYQTINTQHHLETRQMVGELNHKFDNLREGLAHAAGII